MREELARAERSVLLRLTAVVIFLAVCAYAAAWLAGGLGGAAHTAVVRRRDIVESAEINGIAVRREEPLYLPLPAADGERVSAGAGGLSQSAVVFSGTDGLEYLSPDELTDGLSVGEVRGIMSAAPEKNEASGRAVYGFEWYFAALADDNIPLSEGCECEILFDGLEKSASAVIVSLGAAENGERAVLLRLTADTPDFLSLRSVGARIIFSRHSGWELPLKAVYSDAEGNNFVYTSTAGVVEARNVDIIYTYKNSAGDFCLAAQEASYTALREGDIVVMAGPGTETDKGKVSG